MEKSKIGRALRAKSIENTNNELKFTILLKNRKDDNRDKVIDDAFVRAVEYEYAVKYLEYLGIEPTPKNISIILTMAPFKECKITPGWETSGEVASTFNIYPCLKSNVVKKIQSSRKVEAKPGDPLPKVEEKVEQKPKEERKVEQKEISGIPKLTIEVIRKRYLYPFSIDMVRLKQLGKNIDLVGTKQMQLPLDSLPSNAEQIMGELQKPITLKVEDIVKDLKEFEHDFPREHFCPPQNTKHDKQTIPEQEMNMVFAEVTSGRMARLVGLIVHFVYWSIFGHFNQLPIDPYHKTLLFLTIQKILNEIVAQYNVNKQFATFFMPMVLLAIRREIDSVFHSKYPLLFKDPVAGNAAMTCISLLLTKLLDPNVLYSRFSSLESGDKAITLKLKQYTSSKTTKVRDLFYTNSALVSSLLPHKSEGKVRARFMETQQIRLKGKPPVSAEGTGKLGSTLPAIHRKTSTKLQDTKSLEDKALEMANNIQLCNVAFKRVNDNLSKRKMEPVFRVLNID